MSLHPWASPGVLAHKQLCHRVLVPGTRSSWVLTVPHTQAEDPLLCRRWRHTGPSPWQQEGRGSCRKRSSGVHTGCVPDAHVLALGSVLETVTQGRTFSERPRGSGGATQPGSHRVGTLRSVPCWSLAAGMSQIRGGGMLCLLVTCSFCRGALTAVSASGDPSPLCPRPPRLPRFQFPAS